MLQLLCAIHCCSLSLIFRLILKFTESKTKINFKKCINISLPFSICSRYFFWQLCVNERSICFACWNKFLKRMNFIKNVTVEYKLAINCIASLLDKCKHWLTNAAMKMERHTSKIRKQIVSSKYVSVTIFSSLMLTLLHFEYFFELN